MPHKVFHSNNSRHFFLHIEQVKEQEKVGNKTQESLQQMFRPDSLLVLVLVFMQHSDSVAFLDLTMTLLSVVRFAAS